MSGAIPPLPQYAFMAWCAVKKKHRDNFNFTFYHSSKDLGYNGPPKISETSTSVTLLRREWGEEICRLIQTVQSLKGNEKRSHYLKNRIFCSGTVKYFQSLM
jgi:cation transport regulator ChaC